MLTTESEGIKVFFQGGDELTLLLYQEPQMLQLDTLRFKDTAVFFKRRTSVKDLVVIGYGAARPKE